MILLLQKLQIHWEFYAGKSGNLRGTLAIWNDCNNLYVEITSSEEHPDEVFIWFLDELTTLNDGNNQVQNEPNVFVDGPIDLLWMFPVANFDPNEELLIYVQAYGDYTGEITQERISYTDFGFHF
ncbi:hypothetical protein [Salinimicrobium sp. HB62]|uniref:hypothetical protein n=1 Tax=Salinimicrobium sp. HB62 TaxID=3077781 RepID=UPI002D79CA16|nr:hypothetical protein [Salinimicrobium sp. HB62]